MQRVALRDVELGSFRVAVGLEACADGTALVQRGAVLQMAWEASQQLLTGTVRDSRPASPRSGEIRTVSASFRASPGFPLRFREGYCSCATATNCVHVAALVLAATDETLLPATTAAAAAARRSALPWEQPPDARTASPEPATAPTEPDTADTAAAPLAVELSLVHVAPEPFRYPSYATDNGRHEPPADDPSRRIRLQARLVQPGRLGGWVPGQLSWSRLDYLPVRDELPAAQLRLLHEIYALTRAGAGGPPPRPAGYSGAYSYGATAYGPGSYGQRALGAAAPADAPRSAGSYGTVSYLGAGHGDQKYLDLSACESRQLWLVLEQAYLAGLPFVYPGREGPVPPPGSAQLTLDITTEGDVLHVTPAMRTADGTEIVPLRFIGSAGHGVVYTERGARGNRAGGSRTGGHQAGPGADGGPGEQSRFRLARLDPPVSAQLQRIALADERLTVPANGRDGFLSRTYPRFRRQAAIVSSDGSFTAPEISGPELTVQVDYTAGHHLGVRWEWAYQVGQAELRAPFGSAASRDPFRDPEAEAAVLARLSVVPGAGGDPRSIPGAALTLHGLDVMEFTTHVLPFLREQPGLRVDVAGRIPDYHEAGDSLEIGLSADEREGERDWFDLGVSVTVEGTEVPFADLIRALTHGQSHLLLAGGAYFALDKPELAVLARLIDEARALQDRPDGPLRISRFQAGLWEELTGVGEVSHQAAAWQRQVQGLLDAGETEPAPVPSGIQARLRPYQVSGFQWLAFLWANQLGGILADDMGLGKTLQTLALLQHAKDSRGAVGEDSASVRDRPFLIVAPTSVLANWAAEAGRFAPGLKVVTVSDTTGRRGGTLADLTDGADAVVTSYTLLRLDFDAFSGREWAGLILDEAQYVKNYQSKAYQCARRLPAGFKVAITGTPMENNLMELWSLLSITAPGLFPSPDRFRDYYARPIEKSGSGELLAQLRRRIRPLIMRRTKEQVAADLPEKQEQVLEVELSPEHKQLYQTHLQRERQKVLGLLDDAGSNRFTILRSLTLLRQLALSAALVDPEQADLPSAKIDALLEQIEDVAGSGHRALVFSQFTRFLRMARTRLEASGVECCYLDGSTVNRAAVISAFKEGTAPVFLISLKAGGFGLNLTEADYCFLLDPWWNPATEAQAVDRTHRIGQTRNVMVYRLIAAGTIEEKVMALKARKAELFSSVIDSDGAFSAALTDEDIRALFA